MSAKSGIEWTEATWNPVVGCTHVSAGCDNCYAAREASGRLSQHPLYRGLALGGKFTGQVRLAPDRLDQPARWRRPRRIFVNSMSDLFHADVPDYYVAQVFAAMATAPQHTFQVLTKRHARLRSLVGGDLYDVMVRALTEYDWAADRVVMPAHLRWPLPNVWLGVSVEDQHWADIRIPALLETPAAVRWISAEPLLGSVDLDRWLGSDEDVSSWYKPRLDWVVVGGESGPGARPMHPDWARSLRAQCVAAGVPFLFKQWGEWAGFPAGAEAYLKATDRTPIVLADAFGEIVPERTIGTREHYLWRVGKKAAGRELDGRTWDEYPAAHELVAS